MTEQPFVDPGHRVPDEEWAAVVRRAKEVREQTQAEAQGGASSGVAPVLDLTDKGVASGKYFPVSGIPTQLLVLHSAECPLAGGYAQSLTEWASTVYPKSPIASWQRFVDPLVRIRFIPDELGAWHASEANVLSIGWEQAGYARYSREQWLTPDGVTQMESLAFDMAEVAIRDGIPARWLTDAEVTAATSGSRGIKGFCFHRQIDPETRTDPGGGYPADLLMERIKFYMTGGTTITAQSSTITTVEDDEMTAEDTQFIKDKLARLETLSLSFETVLTDPVTGVIKQAAEITLKGGVGSKYVRSEVTGEDTVYERSDDGKLRPIGLAEFQLAMKSGETYRLVPKWMIDAMPKVS